MIDYSATATKIANARREKGFTQEELSVRLGVSAQAVSKWERGLSLPDIDLLLDLSKLLGVTTDYLLDRDARQALPEGGEANPLGKYAFTEPVEFLVGFDLIPLITPEFLDKIKKLREEIWNKTGVVVPVVRIRDDTKLGKDVCVINLFGKAVWEKAYGMAAEGNAGDILGNLAAVIENNLFEFVDRQMTKLLVEHVRSGAPFIVEGVIPERISLTKLKIILKDLVRSGVSVRNLPKLIDTLDEAAEHTSDAQELAAAVKADSHLSLADRK